jgi:hypothetical protein
MHAAWNLILDFSFKYAKLFYSFLSKWCFFFLSHMFLVHFLFLHVFNHTNACYKAHITVLSFNHLVYHKRHEFSATNDRQANIVFSAPPCIDFSAASFCCARVCREVISTYTGAYSKFCPSIIKYKPRALYVLILVFHTHQAHLRLWLTILLVSVANTLLPTISHQITTFPVVQL